MPAIRLSVFEAIFNQSTVPTIIVEANAPRFTILAQNRAHQVLTGTLAQPLVGIPVGHHLTAEADYFSKQDWFEILLEGLKECLLTRVKVCLPAFIYPSDQNSDNHLKSWGAEISTISTKEGEVSHLQCQFVQPQEQAPDRALVSALIMNSHYGLMILRSPEMIVDIANQEQARIWNKQLNEITGRRLIDILPELQGQRFPKLLEEVYSTGIGGTQEKVVLLLQTLQGPVRKYMSVHYDALLDENGFVEGIIVSSDDITRQVEDRLLLQQSYEKQQSLNQELAVANAQLSAGEAKFRSMISQAPVAIGVLRGRELIIETANAKLTEIWGNKAGVMNMRLADALPEISGQPFLAILDDVITSGKAYYEYEVPAFLDHGGILKKIYLDLLYHPLKDESGLTEAILVIASDLTEQVTTRLQARRAETQLRLAIEAGNIGSWHIDPQTKTLEYDVVLARIFGYESDVPMTYDQAIGQVTEEHRDRIIRHIDQAIASGKDYDITYALHRFNDGAVIWLRSLGRVGLSIDGSGMVFAGIVMDVTEQKLDDERKNDFIGMVSHELKTPLTSLSGFLQLLQRRAAKNGDTLTVGSAERSLNQVRKMTTMINGFLDISKLESGKIDLNKKVFSLDELIQEMLEETMAIQTTHKVSFSGCKVFVDADRDKIGNVISNLFSNAVKYAPGGKNVAVSCQVQDNFVQISIKDEGIGIAPEHLEHLFHRFYRVQPNNDNISGFGIGLYLSAEIIRRHNGRIWAESIPEEGSVFHFTLPLKH